MTREYTTRDVYELSDTVRLLQFDDDIHIYRQPGGCLEIGDKSDVSDGRTDVVDLVHICGDDIPRFMEALQHVIDRVPQRHG